jgi:hypothetical protein
MPNIEGPAHCEVIGNEEAKGCRDLAAFCCGHCSKEPSAAEVNETAARLFKGGTYGRGGALRQKVVLLRDQNDTLLGISTVRLKGAKRFERSDRAPYLNGYGREKTLAGYKLADGKTSIGEALILAAVELVTPDGGEPPEMHAFVREDNSRSRRPLRKLGFRRAADERVQVPLYAQLAGQLVEVGTQAMLRITLPSGNVHDDAQQLWIRPLARRLPALSPDVYVGPPRTS